MRVLVCGGRDYKDLDAVYGALDEIAQDAFPELINIVNGGATGADTLAAEWAHVRQLTYITVPAPWRTYGKRAGMVRNEEMLAEWRPDLVVAFPGGRGTENMIDLAERAGVEVRRVA